MKGKVVDTSGLPVIGANITLKGTTTGTITDIDGLFLLDIPENSTLLISYIGYVSKEIKVGKNKELSIVLAEDTQALDEVVVVGYGTQRRLT